MGLGAYLIARLDGAGQLDGLLELLGVSASVILEVFSAVVISTGMFVKVWGCKTKCGHQRRDSVDL